MTGLNSQMLLDQFDRIAEAPEAIQHLRQFILNIAVRGKLVSQDPEDEPTNELFERIQKTIHSLLNQGKIKKRKVLPEIKLEEIPFTIPSSWKWARLGDIASYIQRGKSPKYSASDGLPVISQKCVQWSGLDMKVAKKVTLESVSSYEPIRFIRNGDLLWNSTGTGTIGRVLQIFNPPSKLICDSHVTIVRCIYVNPEYVRTWLRSDYVYGLIELRAAGSTNQIELTAQLANMQVVPLPPLAEQHRIVAKVDELMALCDHLEEEQAKREYRRDRLVKASLNRVNQPPQFYDKEDMQAIADYQEHVKFYLKHLPKLSTKTEHVNELRQSILNLAVRGKLVLQNTKDEPANQLFERIQKELNSLHDRGKIKNKKLWPEIEIEEIAFTIPSSWQWVRLSDITTYIQRGKSPKYSLDDGLPVISQKCVQWSGLDMTVAKKVTFESISSYEPIRFIQDGDLLWNSTGTGTIGRVLRVSNPPNKLICDSHVTVVRCLYVNSEYIRTWLRSDYVYGNIESRATGSTNQIELTAQLANMQIVPLPPLDEQDRIVAKVDALMAMSDQLEHELILSQNRSQRLLQAVLSGAFGKD